MKGFALVLIIVVALGIFAGGTENILTELGYSASISAKGETGYLFDNSIGAIKTNPALISNLDKTQISWTHSELNHDQWNDYVSAGTSFESHKNSFGIGMSWNRLWIEGIPVTEEGDSIDGEEFSEIIFNGNTDMTLNEYTASLSFGRSIVSTGVNAKFVQGSLLDYSVQGYGFDFGIDIKKEFNSVLKEAGIAFTVKDILGTRLIWNTGYKETTDMTMQCVAGCSASIPSWENNVNLEVGVNRNINTKETEFIGGMEFYVLPIIPVRIGYNGSSISGGIGIETGNILFNYCYNGIKDLEPVHKISVGIKL